MRHPLIPFSVAHVGNFNEVMDAHPDWKVRFPSPYSFCFEFLINLVRKANHEHFNQQVIMVMADQQQFKPRAVEVWNHFKWAGQWEDVVHMSFADARLVKPLQAADMLAYETRKFVWREGQGKKDFWRQQPLLSRLLPEQRSRPLFHEAFDDKGLDIFLSQEKGQYLKTPPFLNAGVPFSMLT